MKTIQMKGEAKIQNGNKELLQKALQNTHRKKRSFIEQKRA